MKIKICGLTNEKDIINAINNGADYIGFIFYPKSERYVEPNQILKILEKIDNKTIKKVGVFVNENPIKINEIANLLNLDFVQLHGTETIEDCKEIKTPIIKNIRSLKDIDKYEIAEIFMTDYIDTDNWGGIGKTCDWQLAKEIKAKLKNKKFMLSGGINSNNILEAKEKVNPDIIDICSGVEIKKGLKDEKLIKELFKKLNEGRKNV